MKHHRLALAVTMAGLVLAGCDSKQDAPAAVAKLDTPEARASYGIGLNMGRSMTQEGMAELNSQAVALGIDDAIQGNEPRLTDEELMKAFSFLQERAEERLKAKNEEALKAGQAFLEENAKRDEVKTTESGLQYEVVESAEGGAQPTADDIVTVHYEGRLPDGTVFDSSIQRGTPIDLPVKAVIPGWVEGLQLMHVGDKFKLYIPSELAYGDQSPSPMIPANSVLVFDLELLGIKDPARAEVPAAAEAAAEAVESEQAAAVQDADATAPAKDAAVAEPEAAPAAEAAEPEEAVAEPEAAESEKAE